MSSSSLRWDKREHGKETKILSPNNQQIQREVETKEKPKKQSGCFGFYLFVFQRWI